MSWGRPGWVRSLPSRLVINTATLGLIGRKLPAPGTWGSLAGTIFFALVFANRVELVATVLLSIVGLYLAVVFCGEAEVRLHRSDPGEVILDEFFAMPLCFLGWEKFQAVVPTWAILLTGFALFRLFDILKPFGISRLQALPEGWGVTIDDAAAALVSCAVMHGALWLWLACR